MSTTTERKVSAKKSIRFGQIAVEMGFLSEARLKQALCLQVDDDLAGKKHRLIGTIMLENDWMSNEHIETVLKVVMKRIRDGSENSD